MTKLMRQFVNARTTFNGIIARHGLSGVLGWLKRGLSYHLWLYLTPGGRRELRFDQLPGVVTEGITEVSQTNRFPDAVFYEPSRPSMFLDLIFRLPIEHCRFTFIDIGTGKGRPLLLALRFPFRRIIGVEGSPGLAAVALQNTASHDRIEVVCADATEYQLPRGNLVIYLYNLFGYATLREFLTAVERSLRNAPRQIYIVYYIPACEDLLAGCGWLEKVTGTDDVFAIYRTGSPQ